MTDLNIAIADVSGFKGCLSIINYITAASGASAKRSTCSKQKQFVLSLNKLSVPPSRAPEKIKFGDLIASEEPWAFSININKFRTVIFFIFAYVQSVVLRDHINKVLITLIIGRISNLINLSIF